MQDILSRLPPGFRFLPPDEELISYYLPRKVDGRLTPEEADVIKDYNLYGGEEPWEIFKKFTGHKEVRKHPVVLIRGRIELLVLNTNGGKWHGDGVEEVIYRQDNREFKGTKRRFRYQNEQRRDQHGSWTLLEYGSESISDNIVICKLKISDHRLKESRKRKSMWPLAGTVSNEDNGGCSATGDTFYSIQNIGPMTAAGDNAVTPENAAPAVSAIPALEDDMLETLMNETYWLENLQAMLREEEDS
ncbi:hypothetical protein NC652_015414 [Populus alba x Populus x berolinensis]|nr:hypothetical protein NC652_015414 [Populus alba x Populus x berolinensis]